MPKRDMGHLVCQHSGHLASAICCLNQSGVDKHRPAGKCKSVDRIMIDQFEVVRIGIGLRSLCEPLADGIVLNIGMK